MRIIIVGGGYAGAATAWALARRGSATRVLLLEGEKKIATHASGLNAGLVDPLLAEDETMAAMSARGTRLLAGMPGMTQCGSVRLVADDAAAALLVERGARHDLVVTVQETTDLAREIPLVLGAPTPVAVRCADDGKVDPAALDERYVSEAREGGATVLTDARVTSIVSEGGRVKRVETTKGGFDADLVVNAAGAWSGQLALLAGLSDPRLASYRRHLFVTEPLDAVDPSWPWVWDLQHDLYFRIDGKRLTLCLCDAEPHQPGAPAVSPKIADDLISRIDSVFPALKGVAIRESRACLRTFAPDQRYVVGHDPRLAGFFWVAGLGGSGATAGAAVGELAADLVLGGDGDRVVTNAAKQFDPARLVV